MATNTSTIKDKLSAVSTTKALTIHQQKDAVVPQLAMLTNGDLKRAERQFRNAVTEYNTPEKRLNQCTAASFWGAVMNVVQMGLELGPIGQVFLIPYKDKCTIQISYKGMLELVMRDPRVEIVYAYPVYKGEDCIISMGTSPDVKHVFDFSIDRSDANMVGVYAVCHLKGSRFPRIEVMDRSQIDGIRKRSQSAGSGPWVTDYVQMALKTCLKRLCKTLPMSIETQQAIAADESVRTSMDAEVNNTTSVYEAVSEAVSEVLPSHVSTPAQTEVVDVSTGEITDDPSAELFK